MGRVDRAGLQHWYAPGQYRRSDTDELCAETTVATPTMAAGQFRAPHSRHRLGISGLVYGSHCFLLFAFASLGICQGCRCGRGSLSALAAKPLEAGEKPHSG